MPNIDVCIVEDDADQQQCLARLLGHLRLQVVCADDVATATRMISEHRPRIILSDNFLPDGSGLDICDWIRQHHELSGTYFILMTAADCDLEEEALNRGSDDYLTKPVDIRSLRARLRVGLRVWSVQERLRLAAITDGLTGTFNHDYGNKVLQAEVNRCRRYGRNLAVAMLDIDHFKAINDTFGHLAGNDVLVELTKLVRLCVRNVDSVVRFGGEEFLIILPESNENDAYRVAQRAREMIEQSLRLSHAPDYTLTASVGVADLDDPRVGSAAGLVDLADRAMYEAKHRGRNQVIRASALGDAADVSQSIRSSDVDSLRRQVAVLSARTKDMFMQSVRSLVQALDEKDRYTSRHSSNVAYYAEQMAVEMGCNQASVQSVRNAAMLHDIGKVGIPDKVLMKRLPLNKFERSLMDQVPIIGTRIIDHLRILESESQIIRHQREHFDGTGTPDGLSGEHIPIGARILMVADAFDAMTTDRVYRVRKPIPEVMQELTSLAGAQFDPAVLNALRMCYQRDPASWQSRIDETVELLAMPCAMSI